MVHEIIEHLLDHPAIVPNADWYRRASYALTELAALYWRSTHRPESLDRRPGQ
jgi:hypothetical protein